MEREGEPEEAALGAEAAAGAGEGGVTSKAGEERGERTQERGGGESRQEGKGGSRETEEGKGRREEGERGEEGKRGEVEQEEGEEGEEGGEERRRAGLERLVT